MKIFTNFPNPLLSTQMYIKNNQNSIFNIPGCAEPFGKEKAFAENFVANILLKFLSRPNYI